MELNPCKHCGGEAELYGEGMAKSVFENGEERLFFTDFDGYTVSCLDCLESTKHYFKPEDAIIAWNSNVIQHG